MRGGPEGAGEHHEVAVALDRDRNAAGVTVRDRRADCGWCAISDTVAPSPPMYWWYFVKSRAVGAMN